MKLPWWVPFGPAPQVSPEDLQRWLAEDPALQLVDARTSLEYQQGTLGAARHAPVTETPAALQRLGLDRTRPVVVLCLSGHRSLPGTRWLRSQGYQAYSLAGGLLAWQRSGLPLNPPQSQVF